MTTHIAAPELALYVAEPDAITDARARDIHRHLLVCGECSDTYAAFASDLAGDDDEAFLASDVSATALAYGERVARENEEADELLRSYFAEPEKAAWRNIAAQRRYLHGGVVRRLARKAFEICGSEPLHALTFADAAIAVAEAIPAHEYAPNVLHDLRGRAWKERANALNQLGEPRAALDAITHAERAYNRVTSNQLGLANVAFVRATAYCLLERLPDALRELRVAEEFYEALGDVERLTNARFAKGAILYEFHDIENARHLFQEVLEYAESTDNIDWIAKASYAVANCVLQAGNVERAALLFSTALAIFRISGPESADRINAEWGVARVLLAQGRFHDSLRRFDEVRSQFTSRGIITDAALAALDSMEAMVALERFKEVVDLARTVFKTLTDAGMLTSALRALSYLRSEARRKRLTRETVREVRRFVKRAEREPHLVFVPPPDDPLKKR